MEIPIFFFFLNSQIVVHLPMLGCCNFRHIRASLSNFWKSGTNKKKRKVVSTTYYVYYVMLSYGTYQVNFICKRKTFTELYTCIKRRIRKQQFLSMVIVCTCMDMHSRPLIICLSIQTFLFTPKNNIHTPIHTHPPPPHNRTLQTHIIYQKVWTPSELHKIVKNIHAIFLPNTYSTLWSSENQRNIKRLTSLILPHLEIVGSNLPKPVWLL